MFKTKVIYLYDNITLSLDSIKIFYIKNNFIELRDSFDLFFSLIQLLFEVKHLILFCLLLPIYFLIIIISELIKNKAQQFYSYFYPRKNKCKIFLQLLFRYNHLFFLN